MGSLKKEILELLDKDLEFRYAIAGYFGLSEILKRLDALAEEQVRLRQEQAGIREETRRIWDELAGLREETRRIWDELAGLREETRRIWDELAELKQEQLRLREEQVKLREDFNRMLARMEKMDARLGRVERTLEKLTIDIEDEARSVIKHRLEEMGIRMELTSLSLPGLEINIYGASDGICLIGEAAVRAGAGLADELLRKLERLRRDHPERLRGKAILAIYASLPMAELIEEARRKGIWLLKATEEFHRPKELFSSIA
ncbi:MAG: hypothetical protein QXQ76_01725 [Candidatus Bathyarchaeia archaeon]